MRTPLASLLALLLLASPPALRASPETDLGQRVWVRPLSDHTWLVRSISKLDSFGDVESNAVLVVGPAESMLIDTPATNQQTEKTLGNVQEANPAQWASGVATLQRRYPKAKLVIPGHGAVGGLDLLTHTAELISKRGN